MSESKQSNTASTVVAKEGTQLPGWPEKLTGLFRPVSWYAQFPEKYRPEFPDGAGSDVPFAVSSAEDAKRLESKATGTQLFHTIVNFTISDQYIQIPNGAGNGHITARLRPFAVLSLPADNAVPLLKTPQYPIFRDENYKPGPRDVWYPRFDLIAPKGDCAGNSTVPQVDASGKELGPALPTCKNYGCKLPWHSASGDIPLSINQAKFWVESVGAMIAGTIPDTDMSMKMLDNYTQNHDRRVFINGWVQLRKQTLLNREQMSKAAAQRGMSLVQVGG